MTRVLASEQFLGAVEIGKTFGVSENWEAKADIKGDGDLGLRKAKLIAEVEKKRAIAKVKNLETEEKEGDLVQAEAVEQIWNELIANCKAKLLVLPTKVALQFSGIDDPGEIQSILKVLID